MLAYFVSSQLTCSHVKANSCPKSRDRRDGGGRDAAGGQKRRCASMYGGTEATAARKQDRAGAAEAARACEHGEELSAGVVPSVIAARVAY
jgi:hypothetical protein